MNEPTLLFKLSLLSLAYGSSKLIWLSSCFCLATLQGDVFQGIYNAPSPGIQNVKDNVDIFGLSLVSGW